MAYLPAATKLGQANVFTSVCLSTGGGGRGVLPQCMLGYPPRPGTPQTRHPPRSRPPGPGTPLGADTPPPQTRPPQEQTSPTRHTPYYPPPPPPGSRLQHTVNERPVRILLECILVDSIHLMTVLRYKFQGVKNHFGDS